MNTTGAGIDQTFGGMHSNRLADAKRLGIASAFIGSVLLLLAYVGTRSLVPDPELHQVILSHLLRMFLADAAVQREVLQTQAGVSSEHSALDDQRSTLTSSIANLRRALSSSRGLNPGGIPGALDALDEAARRQRSLLEEFQWVGIRAIRANDAFSTTLGSFGSVGTANSADWPGDVFRSAVTLTVFAHHPDAASRANAMAALARLIPSPDTRSPDARLNTLFESGTQIIELVPRLNGLTARILNADLQPGISSLRLKYLGAYAEQERIAAHMRLLLLASTVALATYNLVLLILLTKGAHRLQRHLDFERAASSISNHFLSLAPEEVVDGMTFGLRQLVVYTGARSAELVIPDMAGGMAGRYQWPPLWDATQAGASPDAKSAVPPRPGGTARVAGRYAQARHVPIVRPIPPRGGNGEGGHLSIDMPRGRRGNQEGDVAILGVVAQIFRTAWDRFREDGERRELRDQLARAQRMEAMGTLAGSLAHEFSNVLGAIRGQAEMLEGKLDAADPAGHHVAQIIAGSARGRNVIDKILLFGRTRARRKEPFEAVRALEEAVAFVRPSLPDGVELRLETPPEARVWGDAAELQQVILNLCTNAVHALNGKGEIDIRLIEMIVDAPRRLSHDQIRAGRYARVEVADRGHGMAANVVKRIFEPFFTTKASGVGTGLGLATVRDIVTAWGGDVDVRSEPGFGTTMWLYIPSADPADPTADVVRKNKGAGDAVLLLKSDRGSLDHDEEILAALGYEPVGFTSARDAVTALEADPGRFAAAIVEFASVGKRGGEDIKALVRLANGLPVLVMADPHVDVDFTDLGGVNVRTRLPSPLRMRETARALTDHVPSDAVSKRANAGAAPPAR